MKKSKLYLLIVVFIMVFSLAACGGDSASDDADSDGGAEAETVYYLGETWTVDGQWEMTITGIELTDYRNEYFDEEPAEVYLVSYEYTNLGYVDSSEIMDGLYLNLSYQVVDAAGEMAYEYDSDVTKYPAEVPVNANCKVVVPIGVNNPGEDITVYMDEFDGNDEIQKATFKLTQRD